ncbi:Pycsar system effector family protein [Streptomyces sp. NPDC003730]
MSTTSRPPVGPALTSPADVDALIEVTRQENARADAKSAALLTVVGIGFTAFSVAGASAVAAPLHGGARWLCVAALTGVCAVAELLLLVLRPVVGRGGAGQRYFATWRRYAPAPERLASELSVDEERCRTLVRLSGIVWRKYRLIRWAVDLMIAVLPLMAVALSVALLSGR